MGHKIKAECGMRDMRNIEDGIWEENILAGSGCLYFNWWDAG